MIYNDILMLACVVGGVMVYNSLRHRQKLTRSGVLSAKQSPWPHLYKIGDDQSFQVVTGLSRDVFRRLYRVIFTGEAPRPGRKSYLSRSAKLGLALVYLGSRMTISQLCISFKWDFATYLQEIQVSPGSENQISKCWARIFFSVKKSPNKRQGKDIRSCSAVPYCTIFALTMQD